MNTSNTNNAENNNSIHKNDVKSRLLQIRDYLGMKTRTFEQSIGLSNGYIKGMSNNISMNTINKIMTAYPEIDRTWLQTGVGNMLRTDCSGNASSSSVTINSSNLYSENSIAGAGGDVTALTVQIESLKAMLAEKNEYIEFLKNQVRFLMDSLNTKDAIIKNLSSK